MDKLEVLTLYKEQYSNELARKDAITSQIQIRFAAIATVLTLLLYISKNIDLKIHLWLMILLGTLALIGVGFLAKAGKLLLDAFWGNEFDFIPLASELEATRKDMEAKGYFKEDPDIFIDYLIEEFSDCAGQNSKTNDLRQKKIYLMNKPFKIALIPLSIVGLIFILGDLDAASARKDISISVSHPVQCKNVSIQKKVGQ